MLTTLTTASLPTDFALTWAWRGDGRPAPTVSVVESLTDAAPPHALHGNTVICWAGTLSPATSLAEFAGLTGLSPTEQLRMSTFHRDQDAVAYAAAHGALRLLLAQQLACSPAALDFDTGPQGKPFLRSPSGVNETVQFSLSHASGLAAVAVSRRPVGIDIERMVWSADLMEVAPSIFAEEPLAELQAVSGPMQQRLFFRYWTLGEALIKATGLGLSQNLKGFAFNRDGPPALIRFDEDTGPAQHWHFGCHVPG